MRTIRLALPLALLTALALASPAAATEWRVAALDYEFVAPFQHVEVGDSVAWNFQNDGHTSTSVARQAEHWDSGSVAAGGVYRHTFTRPGRYQYICIPHQTFPMRGVIEVGTDTVADSVDNFRSKRTGNRVTLSFRLREQATVRYSLRGPTRRTVRLGRLAAGTRSFTVRRLRRGTYRGVLTAVDNFDKRNISRNSFVIR
ncbi:MAG TPA: plastocyanin/azurin family copper-binding protein [Thermoleophilaceae bacterium]|nr:plastocyanin/azurin family copper-binding protein [Thermoleophilaceae bacterium]